MVALPMYCSPIVVTTGTNDVIRCDAGNGAGAEDVTLVAGTYYLEGDGSADCILEAIETALKTSTGGSGFMVTLDANGKVQGTNADTAGTWVVYWGHANTTFDETILGIVAGTTWSETQDEIQTAAYWSAYRWTATKPIAGDTGDLYEGKVDQSRAVSGQVYTAKVGADYTVRDILHAHEPKRKAVAVTSYENQNWTAFWATANAGEVVRYYPDQTDEATYGSYHLDQSACEAAKPQRKAPGVELYGWSVALLGYVA